MKVNREKLYEIYIAEVNRISDDCEWKTNFGPNEIVDIIASILENNIEGIVEND